MSGVKLRVFVLSLVLILTSFANGIDTVSTLDSSNNLPLFATNNSQNDGGSGGDAGNTSASSVTFTSTTNSTYNGWVDDTTDPEDLYLITIPSGYILNVSMSFASTEDFDLYLADTNLTYAYDLSEYSNPEVVSTSGTNISNGGVTVAIYVVAYSGYGQYYLTLTFWSPVTVTQNDAGSGGDVGNSQTTSHTLPSNSSSYTGYVDSVLDAADLYDVSISSGYELFVNCSMPTGNYTIGLIDSAFTYWIDQDTGTQGSLSVTTNNTNISNGGVTVYFGVIANSGSGNYTMNFTFVNPNAVPTPSISITSLTKDYASVSLSNLVIGNSYSINATTYSYPISSSGYNSSSTYNVTATSTQSTLNISANNSDIEGVYGLMTMLYSSNLFLDYDYNIFYYEMMESNIVNSSSANLYATNLTAGQSYSIEWRYYDSITNSTVSYSNYTAFNTTSSSKTINIMLNSVNTTNQHMLEVILYDQNSSMIGYHSNTYDPPRPLITIDSITTNANSSTNTVDVSMNNLTSGSNYSYQISINNYGNNSTVTASSLNYFTPSSSTYSASTYNYTTPNATGYYCAIANLYFYGSFVNQDSYCFNLTFDNDNDGVANEQDLCPNTPIGSTVDSNGCAASQRDTDGDGFNDDVDVFPFDSTQWADTDGDGYGDNTNGTLGDAFPTDPTQWSDIDGDGYGDNASGVNGDDLPFDSTQWSDSDGDGYGDNPNGNGADMYPSDPTQWVDSDGDGYGDNTWGNNPDYFPADPTQWADADGDGYGDNQSGNNPDKFPNESTQWADTDGDGYGDNQAGNNPDKFPSDSSQWFDRDGDGYGDNQAGANPDAFPDDSTQWTDLDGDGYGDNQAGNNPDKFPNEPSQWEDTDEDGYGNNASGINGDQCPNTPFGQSVDEFGCSESQSDHDSDGVSDDDDLCPNTLPSQSVNQQGCSQNQLDDDEDGVNNTWDSCPNTVPGSIADTSGCSPSQRDTDGDGIDDSRDICPSTSPGDDVDGMGCSEWEIDDDNDGIKNAWDSCTGTPSGLEVDSNGCSANQRDTDNDGIMDSMDQCSRTDPGEAVDANGCAAYERDGDQDGVNDELDNCPITTGGVLVDDYGCSANQRDGDGDGLPDSLDLCLGSPLGAIVDIDGCADVERDSDSDGVMDIDDACPYTPASEVANLDGCSPSQRDSDNDGISDAIDAFPNDPLESKDTDGDGIGDKSDYFPNDSTMSKQEDAIDNSWIFYALIVVLSILVIFLFVTRNKTPPEPPKASIDEMMVDPETQQIVIQQPEQWVDENGVNWCRQQDGSLMYYNTNTSEWTFS
jgi:hypothetical protein